MDKKIVFDSERDKIISLTGRDFNTDEGSIVHTDLKNGITTVMVYASWCGHCRQAKPIFAKLAREVSRTTLSQNKFGALDSEKYGDVVKQMNIEAYPTFIQFKHGQYIRSYGDSYSDEPKFRKFLIAVDV